MRFSVLPAHLDRAPIRLRATRAHSDDYGRIYVTVRTTPWAAGHLAIRHGRRILRRATFKTGSSGTFSTIVRRGGCRKATYTGALVATDEYGASRRATARVMGCACPRPPPSDGGSGGNTYSYCHGYGATIG